MRKSKTSIRTDHRTKHSLNNAAQGAKEGLGVNLQVLQPLCIDDKAPALLRVVNQGEEVNIANALLLPLHSRYTKSADKTVGLRGIC